MDDSVEKVSRDERGYTITKGKDRFNIAPNAVIDNAENDMGRKEANRIDYLEGVRGLLSLQTLLWIFFRFFAPAIVTDTDLNGKRPAMFVEQSPEWMSLVRKILSPLLFDGSLQMAGFIILTGRVSFQTFTERRVPTSLAGECIRRPIRLAIPVALALAMTSIISASNGFKHSEWLAQRLYNDFLLGPEPFHSPVIYFNSLVTLFFAPVTSKDSGAVLSLPPYGVMWFTQVAFQQTYVLTVVAWILPFLVLRYKAWGTFFFIAATGWVARWSWYTITGLAICEFSVHHRQCLPGDQLLHYTFQNGKRNITIPIKVIPSFLILLGIFFKYLWIAILPQDYNNEYIFHGSINTGKLLRNIDPNKQALPRYDNWLSFTGFLILLELSPGLRKAFSWRPLVFLGRLSFSIVLVSGTVMMTVGSVLYRYLVEEVGISNFPSLIAIMFLTMIPLSLLCCLVWSVTIDKASLTFSRFFYAFLIS